MVFKNSFILSTIIHLPVSITDSQSMDRTPTNYHFISQGPKHNRGKPLAEGYRNTKQFQRQAEVSI